MLMKSGVDVSLNYMKTPKSQDRELVSVQGILSPVRVKKTVVRTICHCFTVVAACRVAIRPYKPTHTRFYDLVAVQVEDVRHEVSIALHPIQNSIVLASSNGSASLAVPGWLIDVAEGTAQRVVRRETPRASKFKLHEGRSQGSKSTSKLHAMVSRMSVRARSVVWWQLRQEINRREPMVEDPSWSTERRVYISKGCCASAPSP